MTGGCRDEDFGFDETKPEGLIGQSGVSAAAALARAARPQDFDDVSALARPAPLPPSSELLAALAPIQETPTSPSEPVLPLAPLPGPRPADIPYAFARKHGIVVLGEEGDARLQIAMRQTGDRHALVEVRRHLARDFDVHIVEDVQFDRHLSDHYAMDGSAAAMAGAMEVGADELDLIAGDLPSADDLLDSADDAPAIRLINGIIAEAARQGVSDIHVEPYETGLVVRMRIDGVLRETLRMPPHVAQVLVSRIKVMARLDIAERRVPQDGRIGLTLGGKLLDVRVSTLPSRAGERVVLRILDKENAGISLNGLGMSALADKAFRDALGEPNGIILVTGPTGSGKTTTLYAGLRELNDGSRNILTVEDPVEYAVDGVGQTQVNPKVGLTFAAGLRAILRQDPDVVMVGEIRDHETAEIAVQASLTGHLVLSTVHTNDAVGAITRLRDMKVEPFLLASTLRAVIAQRLVRRLCRSCRTAHPADDATSALLGLPVGTPIYRAVGCADCSQSGYKGRIGVFECVRVDETIRQLIHDGGDETLIARHAFAHAPDLGEAVRELVRSGDTTAEEAIRITRRESEPMLDELMATQVDHA
ncbi:type II secretion system ATPase GspE [Sphingobium subterraneum]|uniref:Type II secretion system protein E n=1 Tax=Sphingobium subterraneum TaxID=627688 RepID=A0A841IX20_9SPHN|nr:type II secretion system ATPase GspE [Sphingobium subterraneum]MBB6122692.1 general secretion pathway protein E [Sphingobium subterraneum]